MALVANGTTLASSELATLDGVTAGTATASKVLIVDSSKDITLGTGDLTATTGTFSGAVTGASYAGGAISGTTGTFTGDVTIDKTTPLLLMKADADANTEINFYDGSTRIADISAQGTANKLIIDARSGHSLVLRGGGSDAVTIGTDQSATFAGTIGSGAITSTGDPMSG